MKYSSEEIAPDSNIIEKLAANGTYEPIEKEKNEKGY